MQSSMNLGYRLNLDVVRHEIIKDGLRIYLPNSQFMILYVLAAHMGELVPSHQLIEQTSLYFADSTLYSNVSGLRRSLEDKSGPRTLISIRGVGYILYPRQPRTNAHS